jgi:hypothetical protein
MSVGAIVLRNMNMKKFTKVRAENTMEKIRALTRHIRNVEDNCLILGEKLILSGEIELGKQLIANGFVHDASKFRGIEFDQLIVGTPTKEEESKLKLKMAIYQHQKTNAHHVEYWDGGIEEMPDVYLGELVCDLKARSEEFGTALMDYIDNVGLKRWGITKDDISYKKIVNFVEMLCQTPFQ